MPPPIDWDDLARTSDVEALRIEFHGEIGMLLREFGDLRAEVGRLHAELVGFQGETRMEFAKVRTELAELSSRVNNQLPKLIAANIGSMIGVARPADRPTG